MSLQAILEAIQTAGEEEIRQIQAEAVVKAREILANNLDEVQTAREQASRQASAPALRERARILHNARLEALQIVGGMREALIDKVLERTKQELQKLRTSSNYPNLLNSLLLEALTALLEGTTQSISPGQVSTTPVAGLPLPAFTVQIDVDPRDRHIIDLKQIEARFKNTARLQVIQNSNLDCWGGVIARSADGRIVVINTLEARLERFTPYLRRRLAAFFEQSEGMVGSRVE